jgi:hypothetical protein
MWQYTNLHGVTFRKTYLYFPKFFLSTVVTQPEIIKNYVLSRAQQKEKITRNSARITTQTERANTTATP